MKKKIISLLLSAALIACLGACANNAEAPVEAEEQVSENEEAALDEGKEAEAESEKEEVSEEAVEAEKEEATEAGTEKEADSLGTAQPGDVVDGIVKVAKRAPVEIPENDALAFIRDMEVGWNLGNTFDANNCTWLTNELDYESAWCGVKTSKELIKELKNAGFKTIRIPVSWHNHVDGNYNISEEWMSRVEEVVGWAYDEGMYVIINIHHDNENGLEYPSYAQLDSSKAYVTKIWEQIADRFADYDEHLIFETMNEPRQVGTDNEWWIDAESDLGKECVDCVNQLNQVIVDTIRANGKGYNKTRYIMAPGYCASPDYVLCDGFVLPDDSKADAENRIIVSVHAYTPYNFALNLGNGSTDVFAIKGKKGTEDIEYFMKNLYEKFVSKGIPVLIGEFGALDKDNLDSRMQFAAYYTYTARHYGMSALFWDNNAYKADGECFRLIDRKSLTWTFPEIVDQMMYYCGSEE
ncbi:MAG: glycoside hydrolase family 5 protein [Lachnospiraceae bacterium]|nr:glycoside hydrolase family 5 protein [Lachnospiraceae bacterium]